MLRGAALAGLLAATPAIAGDDGRVVFREEGRASVYGDELQGRRTASGERFDQAEPVAAHPELPLGSAATVVNPETGARVEVEVVDRGPHAKGRIVDLSEAAARRLGIEEEVRREGDAGVRIEATEGQVEEAIDGPGEVGKVEEQLRDARRRRRRTARRSPGRGRPRGPAGGGGSRAPLSGGSGKSRGDGAVGGGSSSGSIACALLRRDGCAAGHG
jgi:rare lipoprotein A